MISRIIATVLTLCVVLFKKHASGSVIPSRQRICGNKPADVIFLLHTSESTNDFRRQVHFAKYLTRQFDVSEHLTQFGMIAYGRSAGTVAELGELTHSTQFSQLAQNARHFGHGARTDLALHTGLRQFLNDPMADRHVAQVAVLLLDDLPAHIMATSGKAALIKAAGISLFVIGIGDNVNAEDLARLASEPADTHVMMVNSYDELASVNERLAEYVCRVPASTIDMYRPPTPTTEPSITPEPATPECGRVAPADILLAVPPAADSEQAQLTIDFATHLATQFDSSSGGVHLGVIANAWTAPSEENNNESTFYGETNVNLLHPKRTKLQDTAAVLRFMRHHHFRQSGAASSHFALTSPVQRIGIVVMETPSPNLMETAFESLKARYEKQMVLLAVIVGDNVPDSEINVITSQPLRDNVFYVQDYRDLDSVLSSLQKRVNSFCTGTRTVLDDGAFYQ